MHITKTKCNIRIFWGIIILTLAWAIWCVFFLPAGVNVTDEGLYCSEAWRLAQGDLPFKDSYAFSGLSFWFLSGVFQIFPGCGLLGLRIVWAVVMLLCAFVMAGILLRYFDPVISFIASGASLFFVTGGFIKVLCYNQMPVLGLLVAVWLWLAACESGGRKQVLFAAGAGVSALMATLCRISLLPVIFLPLLTTAYDSLYGFRPAGWIKTTFVFMAAYIIGLACFLLTLYINDLLDYFTSSLLATTSGAGHSLDDMVSNFIYSFLYLLIPSVLLLIVILFKHYQSFTATLRKNKKLSIGILIILAVLCFMTFFFGLDIICRVTLQLLDNIYGPLTILFGNTFGAAILIYNYILIVIAFSITFAAAICHFGYATGNENNYKEHSAYRLSFVALFMSILMILGTNNYPSSYAVRAISWLPISVAFCLTWSWIGWKTNSISNNVCRWLIRSPLILAALIYVFCGIVLSCYPYGDHYIGDLNKEATSTKLRGIITTSERAQILDSLVAAVDRYSSPGDRILAYDHLPMLYFLTNRLPSTNTTWLLGWPLRDSILNDMISRHRLPKLVIRAQFSVSYLPHWPVVNDPLKWNDADPIDKYIREHYRIIEEIDGVQILLPVD